MEKTLLGFVLLFGIIVSQGVTATAQQSVVGYWKTGGVGTINEVNTVTGQTKNRRGQMFSYTFAADGTYTFVGYMESTMFGCTTGLFNEINGRYMVDGTTIFLNPSRDFGFKTDQYGKSFICLSDAGVETCYSREKE
jgi:hypothetical protein